MKNRNRNKRQTGRYLGRRRGAAAVFAVFLTSVLVAMLAFSVDIGYLAASKSEIQRTADAAALSGCWQVYDGKVAGLVESDLNTAIDNSASSAALMNSVSNSAPALQSSGLNKDITSGYLSSLSSVATLTSDSNQPYRAVRVSVRKTSGLNGQIPYYFARIFGQQGIDISAEATAAMALQIQGFNTPTGGSNTLNILPFALDESTWQGMLNGGGTDQYRYSASTGQVSSAGDGIREVNLYPQGTGSPGNRGTVDIGGSNNSTADLARQIVYGISSGDLVALGKPLSLGSDGTMTLNGDTGISAGVKDELASIIGKTRISPIFSTVTGNGNNANYRIVRWAGVRILYVKLTGSMSSKQLIVQPASVLARGAIVGDSSRVWSDGIFSSVVLVH